MAIYLNEELRLATVQELRDSTYTPTVSDNIYINETNLSYRWVVGSAIADDGLFIISQTSQVANGRWVSEKEGYAINLSATSDILPNKYDISKIIITDLRIKSSYNNEVFHTNADAITNDFTLKAYVYSDGVLTLYLQNLSNTQLNSTIINVTLLMSRR